LVSDQQGTGRIVLPDANPVGGNDMINVTELISGMFPPSFQFLGFIIRRSLPTICQRLANQWHLCCDSLLVDPNVRIPVIVEERGNPCFCWEHYYVMGAFYYYIFRSHLIQYLFL
jgi:hypothetical protein